MKTVDWLMLAALSLLWGCSFIFNEVAVRELPVLSIVAARTSIAAAVLWIVVFARRLPVPKDVRLWGWFLVMGLLNNVLPFSLIVYGQKTITAGLASILNATTPFFMLLIIALVLRNEPVGRAKVVGLVIGFLGVVLMMGPDVVAWRDSNLIGQLAILLAALSYATAGIYGRRFHTAGIRPIVSASGQITMSALILIPVALGVDGWTRPGDLTTEVLVSVTGLAVLSTAVAYILYFQILRSAGSINLMLVTFLMPVTALLLGTFLLDEPVQILELTGMAIIAIALLIIDGRLLRRFM